MINRRPKECLTKPWAARSQGLVVEIGSTGLRLAAQIRPGGLGSLCSYIFGPVRPDIGLQSSPIPDLGLQSGGRGWGDRTAAHVKRAPPSNVDCGLWTEMAGTGGNSSLLFVKADGINGCQV